ncbi:protein YIF1B isoform X1 [Schistocerca piceifrons]|uniref:protein YIF1B isoform X1 n=1 Tax=Schistocerca piceifrons TaxID=274613 RepID=UPI001F5EC37A|nr:protein YIF1B isoform X1 [Schistocerca piceifrons]
MNYNASAGARHPASRKKHYVSDSSVTSSPAPNYPPPYNPYAASPPGPVLQPGVSPYIDTRASPPPYGAPPGYSQRPSYSPMDVDQGYSIPSQFLNEPLVANVAMQYGQALVGSGKQIVDRELEKYVPVTRLKYYFAVDTAYVTKKLGLLLFPFSHGDWSIKYEHEEPVAPRYEVNAPDLYIPTMAYLTYVVVAGLMLGTQNRFSPEMIGIHASSALAWLVVEIVVEMITLYVTSIQTKLKTLDLVAFGGYKYVGMIFAMLLSLVFQKTGYYAGLLYFGLSLAFFLVRTLKVQVLPEVNGPQHDPYRTTTGNKRRIYFLLFMAGIQPVLMWWLSHHLVAPPAPKL